MCPTSCVPYLSLRGPGVDNTEERDWHLVKSERATAVDTTIELYADKSFTVRLFHEQLSAAPFPTQLCCSV